MSFGFVVIVDYFVCFVYSVDMLCLFFDKYNFILLWNMCCICKDL